MRENLRHPNNSPIIKTTIAATFLKPKQIRSHTQTHTKMALQNVQNKDMNLVLSSDAKPRLKWTPELHQRFIDAVNQLGGADS